MTREKHWEPLIFLMRLDPEAELVSFSEQGVFRGSDEVGFSVPFFVGMGRRLPHCTLQQERVRRAKEEDD